MSARRPASIGRTVTPRNRRAWRRWLERNYASVEEIWLVFYKQGTGRPSLSYADAVEEALCFGWIDGIKKRIDADRYTHRFTPRTSRSRWSALNRRRAAQLIAAGLMAAPGRAAIAAAKRAGTWNVAPERRGTGPLPPELSAVLAGNAADAARFAALPPAHRRAFTAYVADAKQVATRERRAAKIVALLRAGKGPIDA